MNQLRRRIQTAMQSGGGAAAFSPASIAGLKLWLDASQIAGLNDGDAVATWSDLSGNNFSFTQSTGSLKPLYKTGIQNGLPAVLSDGVDDRMVSAAAAVSHPFTIYAVVKQNNISAGYLLDGDDAGTRIVMGFTINADGSGKFAVYNGSALLESTGNQTGTFKVAAWVQNGASTKAYLNGTEVISGNTGSASISGLTLFNRFTLDYPLNGYLAEFIIYEGAHSDTDRGRVQTYLNTKWGVF